MVAILDISDQNYFNKLEASCFSPAPADFWLKKIDDSEDSPWKIQDATMAAILNIKTRPLECVPKNLISYSSIKTYVVDTQNNCLNETVLLST